MFYPIKSSAILDVTKPPYCADNTGKTDCTAILKKIIDDFFKREIDGINATYEKLVKLSNNGEKTVYDGFENRSLGDNRGINVLYPEITPDSKIIYFPAGTYLVSDTVTYSFEDLKNIYLSKHLSELCRSLHIMGESKESTVIKLADGSRGFEKGSGKPVLSIVNVPDCMERKCSNVCQNNTVEDITIDCGKGNGGAVALRFMSINSGKIENVGLRAEGSFCGLECAVNNTASIVGLTVAGFEYGIHTPYSSVTAISDSDLSQNERACIKTDGSKLTLSRIASGGIPTLEFYRTGRPEKTEELGVYYLADDDMTFCGDIGTNKIYYEKKPQKIERHKLPRRQRSLNAEDYICVDELGAVGDGKTDSTEAIQKALDSKKSTVIFGSGHYLISSTLRIPSTVKVLDLMYCDLFTADELRSERDAGVFEVSEDSDDILFVENVYTFEQFCGYMRFIKHAAVRDIFLRNIHNQASATYVNTVGGSRVYMDNCASTTGSYAHNCVLEKNVPYEDYSYAIPYEFHGQRVYGMQINPERAHIEVLNDASEIMFDAFKIEGPGVAVKTINGGKTVINISLAAIGYVESEYAMYETYDGELTVNGLTMRDSPSWKKLRWRYLFDTFKEGRLHRLGIEDVKDANYSDKRVNHYGSKDNVIE